ncbi:MAG: hypothetical protein KME27_09420 [Lyngbya sp. HA4199-MV5]|jgi:hypothetical protein|nr:hypothetical protein [Lyngbya sp. HA4199-MV5]
METAKVEILSQFAAVFWVLCGIILSLVLPVAVKTLRQAQPELPEKPSIWKPVLEAWKKYGGNKYIRILLAASLIAVVIVFLLSLQFYTVRDAVLAGFAWESFVNKLFREPENS